jgi:hypothetical protein
MKVYECLGVEENCDIKQGHEKERLKEEYVRRLWKQFEH